MLLSQHIETRHTVDLVATGGFGYLLKDRVLRVDDFIDAIRRVADGGSALDPMVVSALMTPGRGRLPMLTARELEVLALAAEGHSNAGIAQRLRMGERTVESHMRSIFAKLGIPDSGDRHRRVLAVLAFLTNGSNAGTAD